MSRDLSHVSILFVNFVRSQTDKTAQFTGANIKPLLGNFHFKKQHNPHPPTSPHAHTHTLHHNMLLFMAWSSSSTYNITGHFFRHYAALHHPAEKSGLFPHGRIKRPVDSYLHRHVAVHTSSELELCYSNLVDIC